MGRLVGVKMAQPIVEPMAEKHTVVPKASRGQCGWQGRKCPSARVSVGRWEGSGHTAEGVPGGVPMERPVPGNRGGGGAGRGGAWEGPRGKSGQETML